MGPTGYEPEALPTELYDHDVPMYFKFATRVYDSSPKWIVLFANPVSVPQRIFLAGADRFELSMTEPKPVAVPLG